MIEIDFIREGKGRSALNCTAAQGELFADEVAAADVGHIEEDAIGRRAAGAPLEHPLQARLRCVPAGRMLAHKIS